MHRRSFFQALSGLLLPLPGPETAESSAPAPSGTMLPPTVPGPDPEWLREWRRIPRLEVCAEDLPLHSDPHQRALVAHILPRLRTGAPFLFRYLGGSTPGEIRHVLPTSLFRVAPSSHHQHLADGPREIPEAEDGPLYLLAWCQSRNAPRTFRLGRMRPVQSPPQRTVS